MPSKKNIIYYDICKFKQKKMNDIIKKAKDLNICQEWHDRMRQTPAMKNFCTMYFKGDDWAMEQDFPTLDLLRKYKGQTEEFGLFADHQGSFINPHKLALFGTSQVEIECNAFSVSYINIRHHSKAKIKAKDNAILIINILDNAEIEIEAIDNSKVNVYQYSENAKVEYSGEVSLKLSKF